MDDLIEEVLDLWFEGVVENEMREAWWVQDEAFDAEIRRWFREVQRRASAGELDVWAETPKGSLAPVIVLDQFSRNLNRGSAAAFANDPKAMATAEAAIEKGWDREFREPDRVFFYLPHEHSENFDVQRRCFRVYFETRGGTEYPEAYRAFRPFPTSKRCPWPLKYARGRRIFRPNARRLRGRIAQRRWREPTRHKHP